MDSVEQIILSAVDKLDSKLDTLSASVGKIGERVAGLEEANKHIVKSLESKEKDSITISNSFFGSISPAAKKGIIAILAAIGAAAGIIGGFGI